MLALHVHCAGFLCEHIAAAPRLALPAQLRVHGVAAQHPQEGGNLLQAGAAGAGGALVWALTTWLSGSQRGGGGHPGPGHELSQSCGWLHNRHTAKAQVRSTLPPPPLACRWRSAFCACGSARLPMKSM